MTRVRLGIVGFGGMGRFHAANVRSGKVTRCEVVAACDERAENFAGFDGVKGYPTLDELIAAGSVDAVVIATPHLSHPTLGAAALEAGLHVMVEKPIAVHVGDAKRLVDAHARRPELVGAVMLNQRTDPYYQTIRRLIRGGDLGTIRRAQWTITDWFRTNAYYATGGWRATWAGEGGGVLLNQCPHNLDLMQWLLGMPRRVSGFCTFGRYHPIEVEDDVTSYWEYADGSHVTFITSTGESPGTNRLEIVAELGRLVYENDQLSWTRNSLGMSEFSRTTSERFGRPATESVPLPIPDHGGQHVEVLQNFVDAILDGTPVMAPIADGVASLELANAILLSAWQGRPIDLPVSAEMYEKELNSRIKR